MNHVSAIALDALALGVEDARTREHLADCATCRAEAEAAASSREHFERTVFARTLPAITARRKSRWMFALVVPVLATVAILLFVSRRHEDPDLGIKGTAAWQVFANRDGKTFQVHDGAKLAAGDRVRFVVTPNGSRFLLIASVDGSGTASIYYPYAGEASAPIEGAHVELPGSIVLDAAPGPERMFALFSNEPLAADAINQKLRQLGADADAIRRQHKLDVAARAQLTIMFEKVSR